MTHEGRLFAFTDLLAAAPEPLIYAAFENSPRNPQQWWDEFRRAFPENARQTADKCRACGIAEPCRVLPFRPRS